jgi:hypothetical protein
MTIRKVMLLAKAPKVERDQWNGCMVMADLSKVDTKGAITVTFLDGPDEGNDAWLNPLWLMEPALTPLEPDTKGEW